MGFSLLSLILQARDLVFEVLEMLVILGLVAPAKLFTMGTESFSQLRVLLSQLSVPLLRHSNGFLQVTKLE